MRLANAVVLLMLGCSCAGTRPATIPELTRAPSRFGDLTVDIDPEFRLSGYWSRNTLGLELARALKGELEGTLARAGFTVKNHQPDLVIRLSAELSGSPKNLSSKTTLELM